MLPIDKCDVIGEPSAGKGNVDFYFYFYSPSSRQAEGEGGSVDLGRGCFFPCRTAVGGRAEQSRLLTADKLSAVRGFEDAVSVLVLWVYCTVRLLGLTGGLVWWEGGLQPKMVGRGVGGLGGGICPHPRRRCGVFKSRGG